MQFSVLVNNHHHNLILKHFLSISPKETPYLVGAISHFPPLYYFYPKLTINLVSLYLPVLDILYMMTFFT